MYAIIEAGGKQYMVREGDTLRIEKLVETEGSTTFPVLAVGEGDKLSFGTPVLEKAKVAATITGAGRGDKLLVYKMKSKKRTRTKQGHRQSYTEVKIDKISA